MSSRPAPARGSAWLLACSLVCVVLSTAGCGIDEGHSRPDCRDRYVETLVVMAQSVRSAKLVPCLKALPVGWTFDAVMSEQDRTRMLLSSDRGGDQALEVTLQRRCSHRGAEQVPSDEPGTRRFERVRSLAPTYSSVRYYEFPGGCVVYDFNLDSDRVSGLVNEASLMLGFISRDTLHDAVERQSDGLIDDAP